MNRFLGDRFQDINDAIVSAPRDSLLEIEQALRASLTQVGIRLAKAKAAPAGHHVVTPLNGQVEGLTRS